MSGLDGDSESWSSFENSEFGTQTDDPSHECRAAAESPLPVRNDVDVIAGVPKTPETKEQVFDSPELAADVNSVRPSIEDGGKETRLSIRRQQPLQNGTMNPGLL